MNTYQRVRPRGASVSVKMARNFLRMLDLGVIRDRTQPRSDGKSSRKKIAAPRALRLSRVPVPLPLE